MALLLPSAPVAFAALSRHSPPPLRRPVRLWLWTLCGLVLIMMVLGGATRLTESGLSMVEWQPLAVLPPLSEAEWNDTFRKYQDSPQFRLDNSWMDLNAFKGIFWLEYVHRLWGRLIALVVAVPLLGFALAGWLPRWLGWRMGALFVLGGLQGALGWYMVASGLIDEPSVSPYRLAAHLGLAVLLYGALLWTALHSHLPLPSVPPPPSLRILRRAGCGLAGLVFVTILSGAFVAGLDAGLTYNTFPLMNGEWIPSGWREVTPWWRNIFESITAVQFHHRIIAMATATYALGVGFWGWLGGEDTPLRWLSLGLMVMACGQVLLGITTLLSVVPVGLAVAHQGGALVLWSFTLAVIARCSLVPGEGSGLHAVSQ